MSLLVFEPDLDLSSDRLVQTVYRELRGLARRQLDAEPTNQTLQPTALVHEAYLRLVREGRSGWNSDAEFFSAAATAMRRILVERARAKARLKRGGNARRADLADLDVAAPDPATGWEALDAALDRLERTDRRMFDVVQLRYLVGLTIEEAAAALSISARTVRRDWEIARVWLYRELQPTGTDGRG